MKISGSVLLCWLFISLSFTSFSEGTKQILLSSTGHGKIQLQPNLTPFGWWADSGSAPPDYRIHIRIANTTERICIGFGDPLNFDGNVFPLVRYRIKDPSGNIVAGPSWIPLSGQGHISTFGQAVAGPVQVAGMAGYDPLVIFPAVTGDYFIEFNFSTDPLFGSYMIALRYFDITVISTANQAKDGRVWSKSWQFTTDGFGNPFHGKIFVLSDDSVVTSMYFNGMEPFVFTVSCNPYGCYNTGSFPDDRRSVPGNHVLPQYKTFLNDPDPNIFPTGTGGQIIPPIGMTFFCDGSVTFELNVNKNGSIQMVIEFNPSPGIQPEDILIIFPVTTGVNTITWNGNNGLGIPVPGGVYVDAVFSFINGLTNLPVFDVEAMTNGLIIQPVRPASVIPLTYWDDQLIPGGTTGLAGCTATLPSTGCHNWSGGGGWGIGNNNTINTWWYVVTCTEGVNFPVGRTPDTTGAIAGPGSFCSDTTVFYTAEPDTNLFTWQWSYSGAGANFITNGNDTVSVYFSPNATSGILTVTGFNQCGFALPSQLPVTIYRKPVTSVIFHR